MADTKITGLTNFDSSNTPYWPPAPASDVIPIVDISDATMAASGTTKKISINNLLSSSPTASGALTVTGLVTAGSATITGALTVDTTTLKVDATNHRVGIGTASPASGYALDVRGNIAGGNGTIFGGITYSTRASVGSFSNHDLDLITNGQPVYIVTTAGVHTWINASTTAMTLNSTGLGIGASPQGKLHVSNGATIDSGLFTGLIIGASGTQSARTASFIKDTTTPYNLIVSVQDFTGGTTGSFIVRNGSTDQFSIDSSGNPIFQPSTTPATLGTNGMLTVNATSNTNLRFSYRGSDGTTRVANITLA